MIRSAFPKPYAARAECWWSLADRRAATNLEKGLDTMYQAQGMKGVKSFLSNWPDWPGVVYWVSPVASDDIGSLT